jgi:hypothetical protein
MIVGCGYAAHYSEDAASRTSGTRLYRLSDGRSWKLYTTSTAVVLWSAPRAIIRDEIFIEATREERAAIMRVRLDSLGAGDPPS